MAQKQRHYRERPHGSAPKTAFRRWEEQRTRCLPQYCMYAYACQVQNERTRFVSQRECIRYWPEAQRPPTRLSEVALKALAPLADWP